MGWLPRYRHLLPVGKLPAVPSALTPLHHVDGIRSGLGPTRVVLKDETATPTGSTKYRMAVVALQYLQERGVRHFSFSSTGNSASAFAWGMRHFPALRAASFVPNVLPAAAFEPPPNMTVHAIDGDYVTAQRAARRFAKQVGCAYEGGFFNVGRREGLKTAYLEAFEQLGRLPDVVLQAVSSGMGLLACSRAVDIAAEVLSDGRRPRLVGVQQAGCAPMVTAAAANSSIIRCEDIVADPTGVATAILLGDPSDSYRYVKRVVDRSGGRFVAVDSGEIAGAKRNVSAAAAVPLCSSSAAAAAAARRLFDEGWIGESETALVMLSGSERADGARCPTS